MSLPLRLDPDLIQRLRCPICRSPLLLSDDRFKCQSAGCAGAFPIIDGIPVLINDANSLFSIEDFTQGRDTYFGAPPGSLPGPQFLATVNSRP